MNRDSYIVANQETGEIQNLVEVKEGDRLYTAEQLNGYEQNKKRRTDKNFIFVIYDNCEIYMKDKVLKPQDVARLILLSTYCNYNGRIMMTERTPMTKKEIMKTIRESSDTRFNELLKLFIKLDIISIDENDVYYLSKEYFIKGKLGSKRGSRIFIEEIRFIFDNIKVSDIKRLGYIFKILPFISKDYNIVCRNPNEECLNLISPLNSNEISELLGVNKSTISRVLSMLSSIKINDNYFLGWFSFGDGSNIKLVINPSVIYAGKPSGEEIEVIKALFK